MAIGKYPQFWLFLLAFLPSMLKQYAHICSKKNIGFYDFLEIGLDYINNKSLNNKKYIKKYDQ